MTEKLNGSQCYELKAWQSYQAGALSEFQRLQMEEHLLLCESCLDTYLGIVEESLKENDLPKLGEGFTAKVLNTIEEESRWQKASVPVRNISDKKDKEARNSRNNLLISYCAAASIVMFFWVGGYFDGLSGSLSKGVEYLHTKEVVEAKVQPQRGFIQTGWTQKINAGERPSFLKNLIPKKE